MKRLVFRFLDIKSAWLHIFADSKLISNVYFLPFIQTIDCKNYYIDAPEIEYSSSAELLIELVSAKSAKESAVICAPPIETNEASTSMPIEIDLEKQETLSDIRIHRLTEIIQELQCHKAASSNESPFLI